MPILADGHISSLGCLWIDFYFRNFYSLARVQTK